MTKYYIISIFIVMIIFAILIIRLADYRRKQTVYNYISWIEFGGIESPRGGFLLEYIWTAQCDMAIPTEYSVLPQNKEDVQVILKSFQQDIAWRYFGGKLSIDTLSLKIMPEYMFFFLLMDFLGKHECDYSFEEHVMHKQISRKSYGSWGGELYDSENELTDFGVVFEKLYYVVSEYCYRHEEIRKSFGIRRCEYLMKQIDEKHISISRM